MSLGLNLHIQYVPGLSTHNIPSPTPHSAQVVHQFPILGKGVRQLEVLSNFSGVSFGARGVDVVAEAPFFVSSGLLDLRYIDYTKLPNSCCQTIGPLEFLQTLLPPQIRGIAITFLGGAQSSSEALVGILPVKVTIPNAERIQKRRFQDKASVKTCAKIIGQFGAPTIPWHLDALDARMGL